MAKDTEVSKENKKFSLEKSDKKRLSRKTGFFVPKKAEVKTRSKRRTRSSKSGARSRTKSEKTDGQKTEAKPSAETGKKPEKRSETKTGKKKAKKSEKYCFFTHTCIRIPSNEP